MNNNEIHPYEIIKNIADELGLPHSIYGDSSKLREFFIEENILSSEEENMLEILWLKYDDSSTAMYYGILYGKILEYQKLCNNGI